jgi:hypothetical protein
MTWFRREAGLETTEVTPGEDPQLIDALVEKAMR